MKRRQAKKILKTWPRQRHSTLRRAVEAATRAARSGVQMEWTLDLLGPELPTLGVDFFGRQPRDIALRRWMRRRWQARKIARTPVAILTQRLGTPQRAALYVAESRRWAERAERLYLESRWETTASVSLVTITDATGRSVTFPPSSVAVTYGS